MTKPPGTHWNDPAEALASSDDSEASHATDGSIANIGAKPVRVLIRRDPTLVARLRPERELAERTTVGDAYLTSLIQNQFRIALRFFVVLVVLLTSFPLALLVMRSLRNLRMWGAPVMTLLLWIGFYPLFILLAVLFVRRAERSEAEFVDLVRGPIPALVGPVRSAALLDSVSRDRGPSIHVFRQEKCVYTP